MKEGWQIYKLEDICTIYDKLRKPISKKDRVSGIYPYYGASCVQDYVNDYLFDGRYVLIGEDGAKWGSGEDTAYIVEGKFWVNNHAHIIQCNNGIVDTFIYYYFNHLDLTKLVAGAIIPKLTQETLRSMEIPIPPLSEQERIVSLLDAEFAKIDTLKANAEKNLQNAKDLFQAALKKELEPKEGWKKTTLKDICTHIVDCPHTTPIKSPLKTDYPCIRTSELKNGEIYWGTMQYVEESEYRKRISRLVPQENDIIYGREGTFGDAVLIPNHYHFCLGQRTMLFRPNQELVIPRFLLLYVIAPYVYDQAKEKNTGCGVGHVNVRDIKEFSINLPQINDQQSIVARLDALNEKCKTLQANYEKTLTLCDDLKQALLRKAFNGEI